MEPLLKNAETRPEECHHKDDFCAYVENERNGIIQLIIHPSADVPSSAYYARKKLEKLRASVEERQRDFGHDSTITQIKLSIMELDRAIGMWNSGRALTTISGKAKKVQKLMHKHNELYGFIHALLARVEIFRAEYFATGHVQFLVEALRWLEYAENACDQVLNRLKGERRQMALYLRLYIELIKVRLTLDAREEGQIEQAAPHFIAADKMMAAVEDAYNGEGEVFATAKHIKTITHAEYKLRRGNIDLASEDKEEAEGLLDTMHWHSIESTHRVAYIKTALALENDDDDYPEVLENYMSIFGRFPCHEYLHGLRQLKSTYKDQLAHVKLPEDRRKFVSTAFAHIIPHLRYL
jgi:hypothetical protein